MHIKSSRSLRGSVITLIPTQSIMQVNTNIQHTFSPDNLITHPQSLVPLLACLAVCQAAGLPALALGAGGVASPGLHSSVASLGHGGVSSGLHHASHGAGLHSSVVSHHGSHGFSGLHNSVVSHGSSHGGIISSGISSHGGSAYSAPVVTHSVPVTTHVSSGYESGHDHYEQPDPFTFEYGVQDDHYHTDFSEHRSGDAEGNIVGDYKVRVNIMTSLMLTMYCLPGCPP